MQSKNSRAIHSIDTWRFFAMFLVVAVHFPLPGLAGGIAITYAKTAVPFFIIVSGYFCYCADNKQFIRNLSKRIIKMTIFCVLANLFYFLLVFKLSGVSTYTTFKILYMNDNAWKTFWLVNESPFAGHLWFLGSMVYAMILLLLFTLLSIQKPLLWISPLLLSVYIWMSRSGQYDLVYCRNALFCTMPYFMFGCLMRKYDRKIIEKLGSKIGKIVLTVALILCIIASFLEFWHYQDVGITFISTEILTIVLVLFLLCFRNIGKNSIFEHMGRRDTMFIYIMHFAVILILYNCDTASIPDYIYQYGTVLIFVGSLITAEIWNFIKWNVQKGVLYIRKKEDKKECSNL